MDLYKMISIAWYTTWLYCIVVVVMLVHILNRPTFQHASNSARLRALLEVLNSAVMAYIKIVILLCLVVWLVSPILSKIYTFL